MKKTVKFLSLTSLFRDYILQEKLISLDNSIELSALFRNLGWRIVYSCFLSRRVGLPYRLTQLNNFGVYLLKLRRHNGSLFVVKYLKASQLALQKRVALDPIKSLRDLDSDLPLPRLSRGFPVIIPVADRRAILKGNHNVLRWWLTLFSLYRIIKVPGKLKLSTITEGFTGDQGKLEKISGEIREILSLPVIRSLFPRSFVEPKVLFLESASPNFRVSWTGLAYDFYFLNLKGFRSEIRTILAHYPRNLWLDRVILCFDMLSEMLGSNNLITLISQSPFKKGGDGKLGQLSLKEEAAGKIRVFALVDIWSQIILKPLHLFLFSFLRSLPNDGTFDQFGSVKRCFTKSKKSKLSFGYDLSAATDRLPIQIQKDVLSTLVGEDFASAWKSILVNRPYEVTYRDGKEKVTQSLYYSVGQPMGALSSWGMLAVTHHLLVQVAALRSGHLIGIKGWFSNYELLGDDINIFDKEVASNYLSIMEDIGVPINLSKSVCARNEAFEFAKVTGWKGHNVSAISWRMFISQNSLLGRVNIVYSLIQKGLVGKRPVLWLRRMMSKSPYQIKNINVSYLGLLSMYVNAGKARYEDFFNAIAKSYNEKRPVYDLIVNDVSTSFLEATLGSLIKGVPAPEIKAIDSEKKLLPWAEHIIKIRNALEKQVLRYTKIKEVLGETVFCLEQVHRDLGREVLLTVLHGVPLSWIRFEMFLRHFGSPFEMTIVELWRGLASSVHRFSYPSQEKLMRASHAFLPSVFAGGSGTPSASEGIKQYLGTKSRAAWGLAYWMDLVKEMGHLRDLSLLVTRSKASLDPSMTKALFAETPLRYVQIFIKHAIGRRRRAFPVQPMKPLCFFGKNRTMRQIRIKKP